MMPPSGYLPRLAWNVLELTAIAVPTVIAYRLLRGRITRSLLGNFFRWLLLIFVYAIVASLVLNAFMFKWGFREDSERFGLQAMLHHSAQRPWVYRVLSPEVVNAVSALFPERLSPAAERWFLERTPLVRYRSPKESWTLEKSEQWHVAYVYLLLCLLATLFAARRLTARLCGVGPAFSDYAPAVGALFLPLTFLHGGYLYDFPELMFMGLCLIAALRKNLWIYYPLFVLAVLNKESNVLLVVFFVAMTWSKWPRRRVLAHAATQFAIGATIVVALRIVFADRGGLPATLWLPLNLLYWTDWRTYVLFFEPYAALIPFPRAANLISLAVLAFLLGWGWRTQPRELRRLTILSCACVLPLFVLFAFGDEIRNLSLVFPAVYLSGCHSVGKLYRGVAAGPPSTDPLSSRTTT